LISARAKLQSEANRSVLVAGAPPTLDRRAKRVLSGELQNEATGTVGPMRQEVA
jgi:hypothetical protein